MELFINETGKFVIAVMLAVLALSASACSVKFETFDTVDRQAQLVETLQKQGIAAAQTAKTQKPESWEK